MPVIYYYYSIVYDIDSLEKIVGLEEVIPIGHQVGMCKELNMIYKIKIRTSNKREKMNDPIPFVENSPSKNNFLKITGNIMYNFNYRSYMDTPYAQSDVMQHMIQTNLCVLIKDKYPFNIAFTQRLSNSPFFANGTDVNLNFRRTTMIERIKSDLRKEVDSFFEKEMFFSPDQLYNDRLNELGNPNVKKVATSVAKKSFQKTFDSLYTAYEDKRNKFNEVSQWLKSPNLAQLIIEEREKKLRDSLLHNSKTKQHFASADSSKDSLASDDKSRNAFDTSLGKSKGSIDSLKNKADTLYTSVADKIEDKKEKMDSLQEEIVKREKKLLLFPKKLSDSAGISKGKSVIDSLQHKADTLSSVAKKIEESKKQLDSLQKEVVKSEKDLRMFQKKISDSLLQIKAKINRINNSQDLAAYLKDSGAGKQKLSMGQQILLSINQIGIGRTWIDYSELTVKNISLSGVNIEANPGNVYVAAATGSVNYRFRDFILRGSSNNSNQHVSLLRAGIGRKDKNNFIVTWYTGRKTVLNTVGNGTNAAATAPIMGMSAEARYNIDVNNYLVAEFARSSYTNIAGQPQNNSNLFHKVFDFKKNENQAWSLKAFSNYPATNTKVNAYYRKMGESFQSFTLYAANSNQDSWLIHVNQPFWKKRILADASVKKNDFSSPIAAPGYSSSTVFKSVQVTISVPKYPFVTIGYYPSSQLLLGNNNVLYESQFNTLNVIASHTYKAASVNMSTSAVMTQFYNNSTDTGFIYYNASSFTINHSVFLEPFLFQAIVNTTSQQKLKLLTAEPLVSYRYEQLLNVSASVKWSRLNHMETLWGGTAGVNLQLKWVGVIQIQYDKIHLPGYNNNLLPVDMGRVTYYRQF